MKKQIYIDLHAIQTVPPSCINRDDTGSPKTAVYGGVERARVSSQAWKRAMREYFKKLYVSEELGVRTKRIPQLLSEEIRQLVPEINETKAMAWAKDALNQIGIKIDNKKDQNAALFFISTAQLRALAALESKGVKDKKEYEKALKDNPSLDIILFGRMVADAPDLNYDAAAQVAHAISTHGVHTEYDYFTAVDDKQRDEESGAGHLGTVEFNSSTLYRYATLNVSELAAHLGADAAGVVRNFAEAFVCSMPTGRQNTFANRTLPDMVYVTVRWDQPVNLSGAFENAVKNTKEGYAVKSCEALLSYAERMYKTFAEEPLLAMGSGDDAILNGHAEVFPLKELLCRLESYITDICAEEEA